MASRGDKTITNRLARHERSSHRPDSRSYPGPEFGPMHVKRRDILVLAIGAAIAAFAPDVGTAQVGLRELRDEAVQHIGWVAGNAYGHPEWPMLRPHVGKGGQYYNFLFGLMPGGSNRRTEISHLARLYREWFAKGQTQPFNAKEATQRLARVEQIFEDINTYLR